jgi:hypothetical protein
MKFQRLFIYLRLLSFLTLGISGLTMFFAFQEDIFSPFLGMNKSKWLDIHMTAAVTTILLVAYHVLLHWTWVENVIFRKATKKPNKQIIGRRRNNSWFMVFFSLSFLTGFLGWMLHDDCTYCLYIHEKSGLILILIFLTHLYKHRKNL